MGTDKSNDRRHSAAGLWIAILLLLLPLYVLSTGPAHWLIRRGYLPQYTGIIYLPLYPIVASSEPIQDAAQWYLKKWE
jgi:hypothetical protein